MTTATKARKPAKETTTAPPPTKPPKSATPSPIPVWSWSAWTATGSRDSVEAAIRSCERFSYPCMHSRGSDYDGKGFQFFVLIDRGRPPVGSAINSLRGMGEVTDEADLPPSLRRVLDRLRELDTPESRPGVTADHLRQCEAELLECESRAAALATADFDRPAADVAAEQAQIEREAAVLRRRLEAGAGVRDLAAHNALLPQVEALQGQADAIAASITAKMEMNEARLASEFDPQWWTGTLPGGIPARSAVLWGCAGMADLARERDAIEPQLRRAKAELQRLAGRVEYVEIQRRTARRRELVAEATAAAGIGGAA